MGLIVEDLRNIAKFCNQMYKLPETGMFWYSNEYNVLQCKEITNKKRQNQHDMLKSEYFNNAVKTLLIKKNGP